MNKDKQDSGSFSHLDEEGKARMVDVGKKEVTKRVARATASVLMAPRTLSLLADSELPKGDVIAVARIAGIMAAKRTADLIPMCHPLNIGHVSIDFQLDEQGPAVRIESAVRLTGKTGVEMEALTAASVAALTVYDMCKSVDKGMEITGVTLIEKRS